MGPTRIIQRLTNKKARKNRRHHGKGSRRRTEQEIRRRKPEHQKNQERATGSDGEKKKTAISKEKIQNDRQITGKTRQISQVGGAN